MCSRAADRLGFVEQPAAKVTARPSQEVRPRRSPAPEDRQLDAERSRRQLLAAALEEFAAKGFAGARVADIAERAGVNKQLINYYFESKEGLYRALQQRWFQREAAFADPAAALDESAASYLHDALSDPRMMRLLVWRGLSDPAKQAPDVSAETEDLSGMQQRQARGELAADLDPACVLLVLMGAVAAPIAMPHMVRKIFGLDPGSAEFEERYTEQLRRMVRYLAGSAETEGQRRRRRRPADARTARGMEQS